jgi:hypothetical protein
MNDGYSVSKAKEVIATVVTVHIFDMLKYKQPYNNSKYVNNLAKLKTPPWDKNYFAIFIAIHSLFY